MSPGKPQDLTVAAESSSSPYSAVESRTLVAGRYEILAHLGAGGMGSVYKVLDRDLDEVVALKVLRKDVAVTDDLVERFRREAKLARRVTHKNVARTFDIGEHEGERFLTMEYIDGESLAIRMLQGRPPLADILRIVVAVCEGLSAAHEAGVVHRDLKPDNVMLGKDGRVVITDFGIARAQGGRSGTQGLIGTPTYMAPEQVEGKELDARADLFALGVMMFELLTGTLPWEAESPLAAAAARLVIPAPNPRKYGVPEPIASVVDRLLARMPDERFASAAEVQKALASAPGQATLGVPRAPTPLPRHKDETQPGMRTVAVLPVQNGGAPGDEYLADALTEDLIDQLSMAEGLRVRPRGVVMALKGSKDDAAALGRGLDVDVVVEGTLRKQGEMLRVSVRVISVASGFQLWAKRFDRPAGDMFAVSDEVAQAVATALTVQAGVAHRAAPSDPRALDLYLRGRHEYHHFDAPAAMKAVALLDEAAALAPNDPVILTGQSLARGRLWFFGGEGSMDLAAAAAARAVELAPDRAEPLVARASSAFHAQDHGAAVRDLRQALVRSPALADAHELLGRILSEAGPPAEAMHHLDVAHSLEPRYTTPWVTVRILALLARWDEVNAFFDQQLKLPELPGFGWITIMRISGWHRDTARIAEAFEHPQAKAGTMPPAAYGLGKYLLAPTDIDILSATIGAIGVASSWRAKSFVGQARAEIALGAGDKERAVSALAEAVDAGLIDLLWLDGCPLVAPLRGDRRFLLLRAKVKERAEAIRRAYAG